MSMAIANNISAINTKRQFSVSSNGMSRAMEKLSSGYKINTGKDDPSGLLISEKLRSQINGINRAIQNTNEAMNVMGIAEGALNEMNNILKKMKSLAIHSSNTGVTSPDQIAADQAEMDSAIQTLDRIANTTKFSDDNLLNGAKDITFDTNTATKGTQQNSLLNARESNFNQIFKRDGYAVSINFTGTQNASSVTGTGDVDFTAQAMKAYLEVDTAFGAQPQPDVDKDGNFTRDQAFTLTGTEGSRSFKFKKGETVANMVSQIKNAADSTGVDAALVFNSDQQIMKASQGAPLVDSMQIVNVTSADGKDFSLKFLGSVSGSASALKKDYEVKVETAATASGAVGYTVTIGDQVISGWDGKSDQALSGALAGVTLKGFAGPVDLAGAFSIASGSVSGSDLSGLTSGGAVSINSGGGLDKLAQKHQDKFAGATDVEMKVVGNYTSGGSATFTVTITGKDVNGEEFTLTGASTAQAGAVASGGGTAISGMTLSGDLAGLKLDITGMKKDPAGGGVMTTTLDVTFALADKAPAQAEGKLQKSNVDGIGNKASLGSVGGISSGTDAARASGDMAVFNNTIDSRGTGAVVKGVAGVTVSDPDSVKFGMNTDGQGRIYVKFLDDNSFELYKDASMTKESLVATGVNGKAIKEANNSGLSGLTLNLAGEGLASKTGVYLAFAGIEGNSTNTSDGKDGVRYNGDVVGDNSVGGVSGSASFDSSRTLITGVELGKNTSDEGQIFLKTIYDHDAGTVQVFAYKDDKRRDEDMVAKSEIYSIRDANPDYDPTATSGSGVNEFLDIGSLTVVLNEVRNADNTLGTGLGIVLSVEGAAFAQNGDNALTKSMTLEGDLTFTNLGARVFSQDYGADAFVKVTQDKGAIFYEYGTPGNNSSARLVDAGSKGTTIQVNGQDATLSVNGTQVKTQGLQLKMATQDIQADLTFNQGTVGSTTLAQVGYDTGSIFTKIGALNLGNMEADTTGKYAGLSGLLCNAGHVTKETVNNFENGMQLQLGDGSGDQNRTVVALKAMDINNLGRISRSGYWENGKAIWSERTFTMQDVMGGGLASLSQDPTLSMAIIEQAITDVSENRARIGAMQTNLLQTNANNLSVTMENLTKTESGIRDADMADEMTEFTKQQVLQNAAMSMMGQANQSSQNILQLLR